VRPLSGNPSRPTMIAILHKGFVSVQPVLLRSLCLLLLGSFGCVSALCATPPCTIEGNAPGADLTASVSPPGDISLFVICSTPTPAPKTVSFVVSEFWNPAGSVHVQLLLPPEFKPVEASGLVTGPFSTVIPFRLHVETVPTAGSYSGRVVIVAEGSDPVTSKLSLTRGNASATLVLDHLQETVQATKTFYGGDPNASVTVTIREKTGQSGLDGIRVQLEQLSKHPGPGFTLDNNVAFTVNGAVVDDLMQWPISKVEPGRSFDPGGQSIIKMQFKNLEAGEYNAVLRFVAANSGTDDAQKFSLILQVRDSIVWSVALLLMAVSFSFVATKVVTSMRHRFVLLGRIRELHPAWLKDAPAILAVVWVRAVLKEAEDLSRRYWLTGGDQIDTRVNQVTALLKVLDEVRRLREQVMRSAVLPALPRVRAISALASIVVGLDDETPTDTQIADVSAKLVAFKTWLDASTLNDCYWAAVRSEIQSLVPEINLPEISKPEDRARVAELLSAVTAALTAKPVDLDAMMAVERRYAVLKILWSWRGGNNWADFLALIVGPSPAAPAKSTVPSTAPAVALLKDIDDHVLHQVFKLADDTAWASLKQAVNDQNAKIVWPSSAEGEPPQAYDPLRFDLGTGDDRIDHGYLFKHGLKFTWSFELAYKKRLQWNGVEKKKTLQPRTTEPRVIQFLPRAGKLKVKVQLERTDGQKLFVDKMDAPEGLIEIVPTTDFGIFRGLARVEWMSWILAAFVAIVTGLSTLYFKGATFGTFLDYLTLFLWGAGVDQGKNFLQAIQTYSAQPAKSS
jgi:hypothetical protein